MDKKNKTNKNTAAQAETIQPTTNKEERNTTMNTEVNAKFVSISLPSSLQKAYPNYQLYVDQNNIIRKSPDYIQDTPTSKKQYRFDKDNNIIYKESDLIQIIWITVPDNTYFITTYKPRETKKVTETIPGSYGTSITQTYTVDKDYLRDYLLKYLCTQAPLDINLSNRDLLNIIIKERDSITYRFKRTQEQNGQYVNTRYYPIYIKTEVSPDNLPENPEEIQA